MDNQIENSHMSDRPDPAEVRLVRDFVGQFAKTVHSLLLYPEGNPLLDQFRQQFFEAAKEVLRESSSLLLATTDRGFFYCSEMVYDDEPSDTNPAYVLFRDGVREIGLLSTLTAEEANQFLDIFTAAMTRTSESVDIANLLWENGIRSVYYRTVDHVVDSVEFYPPPAADYQRASRLFFSTVDLGEPEKSSPAPDEEHNRHGYQGLQKEMYVQIAKIFQGEIEPGIEEARQAMEMISRDAECDCLADALRVYDEIMRNEESPRAMLEVVKISRRQLDSMVDRGAWPSVLQVLNNVQAWLADHNAQPLIADALRNVLYHAGDKQLLTGMAAYLNDHPQADLEPFREYLSCLEPGSLGSVTSMLGNLEHHAARKMVYSFLSDRANEAVDLVGNFVYDKRWFVVRNVALILGQIQVPRAVTFLKKAAAHSDARVRLEAIRSLGTLHCPEADELLISFIDDPDPHLQIHAYRALAAVPSPAVFETLDKQVRDANLLNLEARVQKELLCAYARSGGTRSLPFLLSLINKKKLFGKARWDKMKVHAVYALGEAATPSALDILQDLSRRSDTALSTAAHQVLNRLAQQTADKRPPMEETD